jgi:hypothetical protein
MRASTIGELEGLVTGLALASLSQMRDPTQGPRIPGIYCGRIRYEREPRKRERWQTALETAIRGSGDCEDLVAYRLAEIWKDGETKARARVLHVNPTLRHVVVQRANGRIEDPSKRLGM